MSSRLPPRGKSFIRVPSSSMIVQESKSFRVLLGQQAIHQGVMLPPALLALVGALSKGAFAPRSEVFVTVARDGDIPAFVNLSSVTASNDLDTVCEDETMMVNGDDSDMEDDSSATTSSTSNDMAIKMVSSLAVVAMNCLALV